MGVNNIAIPENASIFKLKRYVEISGFEEEVKSIFVCKFIFQLK